MVVTKLLTTTTTEVKRHLEHRLNESSYLTKDLKAMILSSLQVLIDHIDKHDCEGTKNV
jgi:hypothetical protein